MRRTRNKLLRARRAGGFTLAEVMLALGILGFALPMVAAALLAGVLETQESFDNTMSTMLEENALAVLRCRVTHSDLMSSIWGPGAMASFQKLPDGLIHDDDLVYSPFDEPELRTKFACVIMGRRMAPNANDYLFVVMAYRKLRDNDDIDEVKFDPAAPDDTDKTCVKLQSSGPNQSAMVNYLLVRMALKPEKPSPDGM